MPALGMSHVAFCVRDIEQSLAFYRDALGFRVRTTVFRRPPPVACPTSISIGVPPGGR